VHPLENKLNNTDFFFLFFFQSCNTKKTTKTTKNTEKMSLISKLLSLYKPVTKAVLIGASASILGTGCVLASDSQQVSPKYFDRLKHTAALTLAGVGISTVTIAVMSKTSIPQRISGLSTAGSMAFFTVSVIGLISLDYFNYYYIPRSATMSGLQYASFVTGNIGFGLIMSDVSLKSRPALFRATMISCGALVALCYTADKMSAVNTSENRGIAGLVSLPFVAVGTFAPIPKVLYTIPFVYVSLLIADYINCINIDAQSNEEEYDPFIHSFPLQIAIPLIVAIVL
jgi:hypothetical protein